MGLSQIELAGNAGIGQQTVVRAEKGTIPRGANITKLAAALGVSEGELFADPFQAKKESSLATTSDPILERLQVIETKLDQKNGPSMSPEQEALVALVLRVPKERIPSLTTTVQLIIDKAASDQSESGPTRNSK